MLEKKHKTNLINLYLDPNLASDEEAYNYLSEDGYDLTNAIQKRDEALERMKKLNIHLKGEKNKNIFDEVLNSTTNSTTISDSSSFNLAARDGSEKHDIKDDIELLKRLDEKKQK